MTDRQNLVVPITPDVSFLTPARFRAVVMGRAELDRDILGDGFRVLLDPLLDLADQIRPALLDRGVVHTALSAGADGEKGHGGINGHLKLLVVYLWGEKVLPKKTKKVWLYIYILIL